MKILITGGTGFLGKSLIPLLAKSAAKLFILSRDPAKLEFSQENIQVIKGDITSPDVIESSENLEYLKKEVELIVHAAAFYTIDGEYSECFLNNVVGTQNLLYFAKTCKNLSSFHFISTVAVAGNVKGKYRESDFNLGQKFSNNYSKTKFDAEALVRNFNFDGVIKIYRLGILIGHSDTGDFDKIDGPYILIEQLAKIAKFKETLEKIKFLPFPMNPKTKVPLIPVDEAAKFIERAVHTPSLPGIHCYHVISRDIPSCSEVATDLVNLYKLNLTPLPIPEFLFLKKLSPLLGVPGQLLSYFYSTVSYDVSELKKDFPHYDFKSYLEFKDSFLTKAKEKLL